MKNVPFPYSILNLFSKTDGHLPRPSSFLSKYVSGYTIENIRMHPDQNDHIIIYPNAIAFRFSFNGNTNKTILLSSHVIDKTVACKIFIIHFKHDAPDARLFTIQDNGTGSLGETFAGHAAAFINNLENSIHFFQMVVFANLFVMTLLNKKPGYIPHPGITAVANKITTNPDSLNIVNIAAESNMSLRNFERRFIEQIGVSPKMFCRIARFSRAVEMKKKNPKDKWVSIAYECGFCNSNHFTREFKFFAGICPNAFTREL